MFLFFSCAHFHTLPPFTEGNKWVMSGSLQNQSCVAKVDKEDKSLTTSYLNIGVSLKPQLNRLWVKKKQVGAPIKGSLMPWASPAYFAETVVKLEIKKLEFSNDNGSVYCRIIHVVSCLRSVVSKLYFRRLYPNSVSTVWSFVLFQPFIPNKSLIPSAYCVLCIHILEIPSLFTHTTQACSSPWQHCHSEVDKH